MPTNWKFDHIENKHTLYCGKDCMKRFGTSLREHAKNIIGFQKKKQMLLFTKEVLKYIKMQRHEHFYKHLL